MRRWARWIRPVAGRPRLALVIGLAAAVTAAVASDAADPVRELQNAAMGAGKAVWGHWGTDPDNYTAWNNHSNRLVPVYTYGVGLEGYAGEDSVYRDADSLERLYGQVPPRTLNALADYLDQTDVYRIQRAALDRGARRVILVVFDGMDWHSLRAAAIHKTGKVPYDEGRGNGLHLQDYRGTTTGFGFAVTSPWVVDRRLRGDFESKAAGRPGGYDPELGGAAPWRVPADPDYLIGRAKAGEDRNHAVTDSAASATSMTSGIKTYAGAINLDPEGRQVEALAHLVQARGFRVGAVSSVPISHATPAAAYAHGPVRYDYQDLTRDMLGLPSVSHPDQPLPGLDVVLGAGWGGDQKADSRQGDNFVPGNPFITAADLAAADEKNGGPYVVVTRTAEADGGKALARAARRAAKSNKRLLGLFGTKRGHLPYQTADGGYDPTRGLGNRSEEYTEADLVENPTLAEMTRAALSVLSAKGAPGFWLMVEAGDVDWASHACNLDDMIGATLSGDDAVRAITEWVEKNGGWKDTLLIVTADHGHHLVLEDPSSLVSFSPTESAR